MQQLHSYRRSNLCCERNIGLVRTLSIYAEKNMGSVNKVFGSILGRNVFVNSAVALYKYVYYRPYSYSFTAEFAGVAWFLT